MCGLAPPVDRLYLDMNGIIHGCSHNNNEDDNVDVGGIGLGVGRDTDASIEGGNGGSTSINNEEIFRNVCYYLDRVIGDIVQPEQLVYMAIDGVGKLESYAYYLYRMSVIFQHHSYRFFLY